jgi:phosphatidylserine/phosphatidylglycerophosphate/cardiolipin synthase-like enzyme
MQKNKFFLVALSVFLMSFLLIACSHQQVAQDSAAKIRLPAQTAAGGLAEDSDPAYSISLSLTNHPINWDNAQGNLQISRLIGLYSNAEGAPEANFIRLAKSSVDIEIYEMSDPAVRAALQDALARKITVRVVEEPKAIGHKCDVWADGGSTPSCQDEQSLRAQIIAAGGRFEKFDKSTLCGMQPSAKPGRCYQHGKMIVIDANSSANKLALVSSGNFNSSNLCDQAANPKVCNRDYSYITRDPDVITTLEQVFEGDLNDQRQDILGLLASHQVSTKLTVSPYSMDPLKNFLESAHTSIQLQNQYVNPDSGIADILMEMAGKGVHVEAQVADLCAYGKPKETNSLVQKRLMFQEMETKGVGIRMFPQAHRIGGHGGYLHAKAIVVDGQRAWVGSVNGSGTSLNKNREFGIFFNNPARVQALSTYMKQDYNDPSSQTWQDSFQCRGSKSSDTLTTDDGDSDEQE